MARLRVKSWTRMIEKLRQARSSQRLEDQAWGWGNLRMKTLFKGQSSTESLPAKARTGNNGRTEAMRKGNANAGILQE